ncbi:MAG: MarR family winged helix-turn-helix transcriptional regulator [Candidatus Gastranaerophilales bacterium]|nr:MarR family winged helix-turn-helix transcriptional regulator [Candidatus Gastranaerophilales bacterium]
MKKHCIQSLFYTIEQTARICRTAIEDYFEQHANGRFSFDDFIILDTVYCFPEVCQRDLAGLILKGTSHTSKILSGLEEKGFIERPVDIKQNRVVKKIRITEKGQEVYNCANELALEFSKSIENIIGTKKAVDSLNLLLKIKETVAKSSNVVFE